jgi:hypothetical protein
MPIHVFTGQNVNIFPKKTDRQSLIAANIPAGYAKPQSISNK